MKDFSVGDKVRFVEDFVDASGNLVRSGWRGKVISTCGHGCCVEVCVAEHYYDANEYVLELDTTCMFDMEVHDGTYR